MRLTKKIDQDWLFSKQSDFSAASHINLPHTWNAQDGQDGGNDYYRGNGWYKKNLHFDHVYDGHEYWLQFDAVAQRCEVRLNGQQLAHHDGGYSAFRVNITDEVHEGNNELVVRADNLPNDEVYPQKADFTFYGGITRDVYLIETSNRAHFALGHYGDSGIKITPRMQDDQSTTANVVIDVRTENTPDDTPVCVQVQEKTINGAIHDNHAELTLHLENVHRWDGINDPYLYQARISLGNDLDEQIVSFGCRTYHFDPDQGFILNGHPYRLIGAAKHEDYAQVGSAVTPEMERKDYEILLEMGGNSVRLAHYQHSDYEYALADQLGILVWAEIPVITKYMATGDHNAEQQLTELICQNWNHASIFCWTLSNEITVTTGVTDELLAFHKHLNQLAHQLDDSRPTSMANAFMLEDDSPLLKVPDIRTYNIYYGWYVGKVGENDQFIDHFHQQHPDMSIGLSEYGADNNPNLHSTHPEQGDYSEEYAALFHEHMLKMWAARPWISMMFSWTLFDFAADGRTEGGKNGQNQKGLVTNDRRIKKDAFYIYKAYLSHQPFVHICGHRFVKRPVHTTIKVYSNQPEVELLIDQQPVAHQKGHYVFNFPVMLHGNQEVTVRSGECTDTVHLVATDQPVAEYSLSGSKGPVQNWFDEQNDDHYYSLNDSIAVLSQNPQAVKIVKVISDKATAAFGDVAKNNKMPASMQAKMNAQPFSISLKMVKRAFKPGELDQYNRELQQIPKK